MWIILGGMVAAPMVLAWCIGQREPSCVAAGDRGGGMNTARDACGFSPAWMLPAALQFVRWMPARLLECETERLMPRMRLLYGPVEAGRNMRTHLAEKCLCAWLGAAVAAFLGGAGGADARGLALLPMASVLMWVLSDRRLEGRYRHRCRILTREFPDFVSKLALLTGAGLHVRQALRRLVGSPDAAHGLLQGEVARVLASIDGGMPENQAWSELAEQCRIREIAALSGILIQHARLGGGEMSAELRRMASDSWEARKLAARRTGEEASAKLVLPLAILFLAVLLVSVAPAFMAIGGVF